MLAFVGAGAAPVWSDLAAPVCEAGGCHAQRSLLFLTCVEAARRAGDTAPAHALASAAAARKASAPRVMPARREAAELAPG